MIQHVFINSSFFIFLIFLNISATLYSGGKQSWDPPHFSFCLLLWLVSFLQAVMGPFVKRAKETNERNDIPKLKENESGKCEENLNEKWFRDMNIFGSFITRKIFFYLYLRDSILHQAATIILSNNRSRYWKEIRDYFERQAWARLR